MFRLRRVPANPTTSGTPSAGQCRETITIPLADHVRVGAGKAPMLANSESVSATKSDNDDYVVNSGTLRFTARRDYSTGIDHLHRD